MQIADPSRNRMSVPLCSEYCSFTGAIGKPLSSVVGILRERCWLRPAAPRVLRLNSLPNRVRVVLCRPGSLSGKPTGMRGESSPCAVPGGTVIRRSRRADEDGRYAAWKYPKPVRPPKEPCQMTYKVYRLTFALQYIHSRCAREMGLRRRMSGYCADRASCWRNLSSCSRM